MGCVFYATKRREEKGRAGEDLEGSGKKTRKYDSYDAKVGDPTPPLVHLCAMFEIKKIDFLGG
jgi:hypothetical protein